MRMTLKLLSSGLMLLAISPVPGNPSSASSEGQPTVLAGESKLKTRLGDRPMSIELKDARLPDVVKLLSQGTGLSVLADAYPDDATVPALSISKAPVSIVVEQLSRVFEREALLIGDVLVLRHRLWYLKHHYTSPLYTWNLSPQGHGRLSPGGEQGLSTLTGSLAYVSAQELGRQVSRVGKQRFTVHQPLAARRVHLQCAGLTVPALAEALSALLNGSPDIALRQTDEQKRSEEERLVAHQQQVPEDRKISDELKDELAKILSPEQRAALANRQAVDFPFDQLPPRVRDKAQKYARIRWEKVSKALGDGKVLDQNKNMSLNLRPEPFLGLGVDGYLDDGTKIGF